MDDAALRESLQELYEHAPCGYVFTRPDGAFLRVNDTFLEMTGYGREELLGGRRFQELLTPPGRIFYENQYAPLLRLQGYVREVALDLRRPTREPLPVIVNSVQRSDDSGQPLLVASTIFDATHRRTYERELLVARRRAEQLAVVVTEAGDAILTATPDGVVQSSNPGAKRLFAAADARIVGRGLADLLPTLQPDAEGRRVERELRSGRTVRLEGLARRPDGERVEVSIGLAPHMGLLGELDSISAIVRDVSEQARTQRKLDEDRDAFLATLSHDLKNPLTGIVGYAQMLARRIGRTEAPEWLPRGLGQIETNAHRTIAMLDELLDLARLRMGLTLQLERRPTDLVGLAGAAVAAHQTLAEKHLVELRTALPALVGVWDRFRLARVLDNLLGNAIKYSPSGGPVHVTVDRQGQTAVLAVADQGIGIPAEEVPLVLERFTRASNAVGFLGTGVGLWSVNHLVRAHGGELAIESEEGVGTTVTVRLPLEPPKDDEPAARDGTNGDKTPEGVAG